MDKEFVTYEQALALKELALKKLGVENIGHTFGFYASFYTTATPTLETEWHDEYDAFEIIIFAPLKQQVFRWFREKYGWYANLSSWIHEEELGTYHEYDIYGTPNSAHGWTPFKTYEEAENACIDKLIELAKQQRHD
jgi:hypothetical protein